jgi:hypothetical protein
MESFKDEKWFRGVFWYNWTPDPSFGGENNNCMTMRGKPAEAYVRELFGAEQPAIPVQAGTPQCLCTL